MEEHNVQLTTYFDEFLRTTVNLNASRLDQLKSRVSAIEGTLRADPELGERVLGSIRQGSWAHRTIIKPFNNHEFDADVLVKISEDPAWEPREYVRRVRSALKNSPTYSDMVGEQKNRCVRVRYANDCHIDVVPYIELADGRTVITKYEDSEYEDANPEGFTEWIRERDAIANRNLRKVIRLLKYLRDYKQTFTAPSIILTLLVAERVTNWDAETRYRDVPTALRTLLLDLSTWIELYAEMPRLEDPSAPGTTFNHRWTEAQYANFRTKIQTYARWVDEAYKETDKQRSITAWQKIFGANFKAPTGPLTAAASGGRRTVEPYQPAPKEQFIEDRGFKHSIIYKARIDAVVDRKHGFRSGSLRSFRSVGIDRKITFTVTTDTPEPFSVFWKVRNTGDEAAGELRGEIIKDDGSMSRVESTRFRGRHYVEVYITRGDLVLAMDRHDVVIA